MQRQRTGCFRLAAAQPNKLHGDRLGRVEPGFRVARGVAGGHARCRNGNGVVGEIGDIFPPELILFRYPKIEQPALYWIDLTFGLALTAVAEELVFRSIARDFLGRYMSSTLAIVAASALIFAAIHWSHGIGAMVTALFAGAVLMALFMRTGSVVPCMIAHYAVNAADFL